jgi:hypothetical protein
MLRWSTKLTSSDPKSVKRANGGLVAVVIGFIVAAVVLLAVLFGGNGVHANVNSPSYIDGSNFANANYSNDTAASNVCNISNVSRGESRSQWVSGCLDAWATDRLAINNSPGMPGLNVGSP